MTTESTLIDADALELGKVASHETCLSLPSSPEELAKFRDFAGVRVLLEPSFPFTPRGRTERWVLEMLAELRIQGVLSRPSLRVLDLCSGSGAIGASVMASSGVPNLFTCGFHPPHVTFCELHAEHASTIQATLELNGLDSFPTSDLNTPHLIHGYRCKIYVGSDLLSMPDELDDRSPWDLVVCNPPYYPAKRSRPSNTLHEAADAFEGGGKDGLVLTRRIATLLAEPGRLSAQAQIWLECDRDGQDGTLTAFQQAFINTSFRPSVRYCRDGKTRTIVVRPM